MPLRSSTAADGGHVAWHPVENVACDILHSVSVPSYVPSPAAADTWPVSNKPTWNVRSRLAMPMKKSSIAVPALHADSGFSFHFGAYGADQVGHFPELRLDGGQSQCSFSYSGSQRPFKDGWRKNKKGQLPVLYRDLTCKGTPHGPCKLKGRMYCLEASYNEDKDNLLFVLVLYVTPALDQPGLGSSAKDTVVHSRISNDTSIEAGLPHFPDFESLSDFVFDKDDDTASLESFTASLDTDSTKSQSVQAKSEASDSSLDYLDIFEFAGSFVCLDEESYSQSPLTNQTLERARKRPRMT